MQGISGLVLKKIRSLSLDTVDVKDIGRAVKGFAWEHEKVGLINGS